MSIYLITGKLGSGKTLACVGRIRDALLAGKRIATNLDLNLDRMLPRTLRTDVVRIPDKPTLADLEAIGLGNEERDEAKNGIIVLDELGAWLNTRSWGDKERQPVIDWLLHSRKKGWDVYFIIQHANMVDKQVREGLAEFLVTCRRTDRLRIPFLTALVKGWGVNLRPPQIHVATVRYGLDPEALVSDRWWYRGRDLYNAYDTRQVFTNARTGVYTLLSPCHLSRLKPRGVSALQKLKAWLWSDAQRRPAARPKHPMVQLLQELPADKRVRQWKRLDARGALFILAASLSASSQAVDVCKSLEQGLTTYMAGRCPQEGQGYATVRLVLNVIAMERPVPVVPVPSSPSSSGPGPVTWGMGPANSSGYRSCSGAACDLPARHVRSILGH